jgi:hypothetical protein
MQQLAYAWSPDHPETLTVGEIHAIRTAVFSVFLKVAKLYDEITPFYVQYGFTPPSPGVMARDLSEKIEVSITQHGPTFQKSGTHHDLKRTDHMWEVKICQQGLTVNQSATIRGEHYVVVNYARTTIQPTRIWILWGAEDGWFSPRKANTNARRLMPRLADHAIQMLYDVRDT